jgi:hypothetical protein
MFEPGLPLLGKGAPVVDLPEGIAQLDAEFGRFRARRD